MSDLEQSAAEYRESCHRADTVYAELVKMRSEIERLKRTAALAESWYQHASASAAEAERALLYEAHRGDGRG